ncbi:MAG: TIGR00282 family metallophosphoesterase [Acidobacteria bacterium]|nr:TIGR00282 family metallophosphoesterase [Acidobacteriota bacterium]
MRILFVGDIVGRPGRDILAAALPRLTRRHGIDFVIANAENSAGGFGVTRETGDAILRSGVHVMTSGNHIWDKKEVFPYIADEPRLLRPLNYPAGAPGEGAAVFTTPNGERVAVINAMGRVHMPLVDDPFAAIDRALVRVRDEASIVIVDVHAEVTSEKISLAWHLDGRATLVVGTHTHVQTADERILPHGTAAITDVGMTGPHDGVIGVEKVPAISRFLNGLPSRFETATGDPRLCAVLVEADDASGRARSILRLSLSRADVDAIDD